MHSVSKIIFLTWKRLFSPDLIIIAGIDRSGTRRKPPNRRGHLISSIDPSRTKNVILQKRRCKLCPLT